MNNLVGSNAQASESHVPSVTRPTMRTLPLRPCLQPGCSELVTSGRCHLHTRAQSHERDARRENAYQRGYDKRWARCRAAFLALHPLCDDCRAQDLYTTATEVHHVLKLADYPELKFESTNLMALCHTCHYARTINGE